MPGLVRGRAGKAWKGEMGEKELSQSPEPKVPSGEVKPWQWNVENIRDKKGPERATWLSQ